MAEPPTTTTTEVDPTRKPPPTPTPPPLTPQPLWGTLEDLLLTCAVNRHGTNSWTSVSNELNNHRCTSLFTPHLCHIKFLDLQRRFSATATATADAAVWLDELRRLRVAELKRDLHRYDLSIVSLQLKVKRLKEEREKSITEDVDEREKSDEKKTSGIEIPALDKDLILIGESKSSDRKTEPEVEPAKVEPDRGGEPGRGVDSCNGSSNSKEEERVVESGELGESVSDVQSTASLRRREKAAREVCGNSSGGEENQSLGSKFSGGGDGGGIDKEGEGRSGGGEGKSKRFVEFLDVVRTRACGSVFKGRLESQESTKYKSLIKEHIDLGIIQKRVEEGRYSNCHTLFYRDLILLVNNAVIFFSKTSSEHKSAVELRELATQHFQTHLSIKNGQTLTANPLAAPRKSTKPEVVQADHTDLKPKLPQLITGPVIACRKRSSIAGKLSTPAVVKPASSEGLKKDDDKLLSTSFSSVIKKQTRDQNVTPRNSANKNQSSHPSPTQKLSQRNKGESSETKADIKKSSPRISKQGSRPGKDLLLDVLDSAVKRKIFGNGNGGTLRSDRHKDQGRGSHSGLNKKMAMEKEKEKEKEKEERDSSRNKNGRASKKPATAVAVSGKRGRDGGRDSDPNTKKRQRR